MNPAELDAVTPEMLARLARPGPRYTSYPTAVVFDEAFGPNEYSEALGRFVCSGRPLSLYVHLPFCRSLCHYCACNVIVTQKPGVAAAYLDELEREVSLVRDAMLVPAAPRVTQLHLGGGTPTFLTPAELQRLQAILSKKFDLSAVDEMAVEVDPRVTSREQLALLGELGWNRASFGVQDFDPQVQHAINRLQSVEETEALVVAARELGYQGINIDLIYGLPFQNPTGFGKTLAEVIRLRPDRIALYSYAHVPWLRVTQRRFDTKNYPMPGPDEKLALFRQAVRVFLEQGYRHLGMDHFALPEDELSQAQARGELHRNFQGYTVKRAQDLLALGISGISDLAGVYAQNAKDLDRYMTAVGNGELPTVRGWRLTEDDEARREVITAIMTDSPLPTDLASRFPEAVAALAPLEEDGLVRLGGDGGFEVTPLGRFFVRNVAMCFDRYLSERSPTGPTFSQTV